ncbi:hypothetical protein [Ornithinibacillus sp. 179-J 7C1 HS]|uniref:hypothetical protein n=1 Tax=Ornithinibacillus sp. 179-J 7C1 HS TaxID=3142384 RepID=UPI0039A2452A
MPYEFLTAIVIASIVSLILSMVYKNKEKQDTGFVLSYYKLSYRRKMIRTLWTLPIVVIALIVMYFHVGQNVTYFLIFSILLLTLFLIQFFYNYLKWKKYEKGFS